MLPFSDSLLSAHISLDMVSPDIVITIIIYLFFLFFDFFDLGPTWEVDSYVSHNVHEFMFLELYIFATSQLKNNNNKRVDLFFVYTPYAPGP